MKINQDVFQMDTPLQKLRYFIREGHIVRHLIDRFKWHVYPRLRYVARFPNTNCATRPLT